LGMNQKLITTLLDLHEGGRSGVLRVQRDTVKKQLILSNGLLALAESNLPQEHLARIMTSMGLLSRTKITEIASAMKSGKTSEESILALPGLTVDALEKGRSEQAIWIMSSLLAWEDCDICFYPGEGLVRHQVKLGIALPELILICTRRAVSKHSFAIPAQFFDRTFSVPDELAARVAAFPLNSAESRACSLLKTATKAADVLPLIAAEEAEPQRVLYSLYLLGLIAPELAQPDSDSVVQRLEEMLERFRSADLYEVLSISADASPGEIQAAYHEQARELHPDRFQTGRFSAEIRRKAETVFARINEAYQMLRNPVSRAEYDETRPARKRKQAEPKAAVEQSQEEAAALYREGRTLLSKGDFATAVERLNGAAWLCPGKAVYLHCLGVAESEIPKLRKSAEQHLLKALELEDMSADTHLALAKLYVKVMLPRKAEIQIRQALSWEPDNVEAKTLAAELKKL